MSGKILLGALIVLATAVGATASLALMISMQHFPQVVRSGLVANCDTLQIDNSHAIPPISSTGFVRFDCGTAAAFTVVGSPTVTPTFTLPSGYSSLGVVKVSAQCQSVSEIALTSGSSVSLAAGDYFYCGTVDSSTSILSTFDISWNV